MAAAARTGHSIRRTAWEWGIRTEQWRIDSAVISQDAVATRIAETSLRAAGSKHHRVHRLRDQAREVVSEVPDLNRVIGPAHRMARAARFARLHPTAAGTAAPARLHPTAAGTAAPARLHPTAARTVAPARLHPTAARTTEPARLPVIALLRPRVVADLAQLLPLVMEAVSMVEAEAVVVFTAVVEAAVRMAVVEAVRMVAATGNTCSITA